MIVFWLLLDIALRERNTSAVLNKLSEWSEIQRRAGIVWRKLNGFPYCGEGSLLHNSPASDRGKHMIQAVLRPVLVTADKVGQHSFYTFLLWPVKKKVGSNRSSYV